MNAAERVDRALEGLRDLKTPQAEPGEEARRRRLVVGRLDAAHLEFSVKKKLLLSGAGLVGIAVAAAILLAIGLAWLAQGSMEEAGARVLATTGTVHIAGETGREAAISTLAPDAEIATLGGSSAKLETQSGVRMALGARSRLQIAGRFDDEGVERVELSAGRIDVRVPKLGTKRQFRVVTPDAVVIVHGTEFSVEVSQAKAGAPRTEVQVRSGRVEVRRKSEVVFLSRGNAWSSKSGASEKDERAEPEALPKVAEDTKPEAAGSEAPSPAERPGKKGGAKTPATTTPPSRLAQANALLARAQAAARRGDDRAALVHLDELLRRFGASPVAASARVERFRALKRLGRDAEASSAAEDYLEKERDGLARDEARALGK